MHSEAAASRNIVTELLQLFGIVMIVFIVIVAIKTIRIPILYQDYGLMHLRFMHC